MIGASCHCGAVRIEVAAAPAEVTQCNCSICRRNGALWAYYNPAEVRVAAEADALSAYLWGDHELALHHCRTCGCTTHWSPVDPDYPRMGVNARLMDPEVLAAARVKFFDGAAM